MKQPRPVIPRLLPDGGCVLVLGSGPSLTQADVDYARARVDCTIAVNDSYLYATDADVLYAGDVSWWKWHDGAMKPHTHNFKSYPAFTGRYKAGMVTMSHMPFSDVAVYRPGPMTGLSMDPKRLNRGYNSVYQSIGLAVHMGATAIYLIGVDMQPGKRFSNGAWRPADHFWGYHANRSAPPYDRCKEAFATLVEPLAALGIGVVNCTPGSALQCFPMRALREVFPETAAVVA